MAGATPAGVIVNGAMTVASASSTATFTADQIGVALNSPPYDVAEVLSNYSETIDLTTTGAGGMDTGSPPTNGFACLYAIDQNNGATSILACDVTTSSGTLYSGANMPTGYIYSVLIGVWPTDGSGKFQVGVQKDRHLVFPQTSALSNGTSTSITSVSLSSIVPSNAVAVDFFMGTSYSSSAGFSAAYSDANGSGLVATGTTSSATTSTGVSASNLPMGTPQTIYYQVFGSGSSCGIGIVGYWF